MSSHENNGVPYKVIAYGLFVAVIGLVIHTYMSNLTAQALANTQQDNRIESLENLTQRLGEANLLLTQIVCQNKGIACPTINIKK